MNNLEYSPGATKDASESLERYVRQRPLTALRLLDTLEYSYRRIVAHPKQFPSYIRKTRRLILHEFPFSIVFRELDQTIQIVAGAYTKRHPSYWKKRLTTSGEPS